MTHRILSRLVKFISLLLDALALPPAHAQTRSQSPPQIRFLSGKSSLAIPFETSNNLILLQASINDSAPMRFILDTGADSTVIDTGVAKVLGLQPASKIVGTGSAGNAEALIFKGITLRLPNIEASNQTVAALPLDFLSPSLGVKISGIIGNDIIKSFVVEVDYASALISLYEPSSFVYSGTGDVVSITFQEELPFVQGSVVIGGRTIHGKFELDSGSTGALLFNTPFVTRHRLLNAINTTNRTRIGGVGGSAQAFLGRVQRFVIGRTAIDNPVGRFSQSRRGDYASARYDGLIGGEIFRRHKTIFDYSRRQLILEPAANAGEPFEVDMSGLKLVADGEDYSIVLVDDVEVRSAAAKGGIRGGDIITAVDGRPTKEFTFDQIRRLFMQEGKEYLLTVKRGKQTFQTRVKLQRLV